MEIPSTTFIFLFPALPALGFPTNMKAPGRNKKLEMEQQGRHSEQGEAAPWDSHQSSSSTSERATRGTCQASLHQKFSESCLESSSSSLTSCTTASSPTVIHR